MWYRFDLLRFAWQMLPPMLRSQFLQALLRVLFVPLLWLYDHFSMLRSHAEIRLLSNGQAIAIVDALTRYHNTYEGDIYLTDGESNIHYLRLEREGQTPLYLQLGQSADTLLTYSYEGRYAPDFYVHLPDYLIEQEADTLQIINRYKPAGRRYALQYYNYG